MWEMTLYIFAALGAISVIARLTHWHVCPCGFRTMSCNAFITHISMKHEKKKR